MVGWVSLMWVQSAVHTACKYLLLDMERQTMYIFTVIALKLIATIQILIQSDGADVNIIFMERRL